uniref:Uncharacterized protein n=1 Tax=Ditylenchus dipsaci TaxID=166011 RepID=A0A915E769_9BILA
MLLVASERKLLLTQQMNKLKEVHTLKLTSAGKGWVKMPEVENRDAAQWTSPQSIFVWIAPFTLKPLMRIPRLFRRDCQVWWSALCHAAADVMDMGTMRSSIVQVRESIRFEQLPVDFVASIEFSPLRLSIVRPLAHRPLRKLPARRKLS